MRARRGVLARLLHVDGTPIVVHAWERRREGTVRLRAAFASSAEAATERLDLAIERMRFALGVDEDYTEFYDAFRGDNLLGRAIRGKPWTRPRRHA